MINLTNTEVGYIGTTFFLIALCIRYYLERNLWRREADYTFSILMKRMMEENLENRKQKATADDREHNNSAAKRFHEDHSPTCERK